MKNTQIIDPNAYQPMMMAFNNGNIYSVEVIEKEHMSTTYKIIGTMNMLDFLMEFYNKALPTIKKYNQKHHSQPGFFTAEKQQNYVLPYCPTIAGRLSRPMSEYDLELCNEIILTANSHNASINSAEITKIVNDGEYMDTKFTTRYCYVVDPNCKQPDEIWPQQILLVTYEVTSIMQIIFLASISLRDTGTNNMNFCSYCGKAFKPVRTDQKYCSASCKKKQNVIDSSNDVTKLYKSRQTYIRRLISSYDDQQAVSKKYDAWQAAVKDRTNKLKKALDYWNSLSEQEQQATVQNYHELHLRKPDEWDEYEVPTKELDAYRAYLKKTWEDINNG